jgi:hypothetical protein
MLDFGINKSVDFGEVKVNNLIIKLQSFDRLKYEVKENLIVGDFKSKISFLKPPYSQFLMFKFHLLSGETKQLEILLNFHGKFILLSSLIASIFVLSFALTISNLSDLLGIGITAFGFFAVFVIIRKGIKSEVEILVKRLMTCR